MSPIFQKITIKTSKAASVAEKTSITAVYNENTNSGKFMSYGTKSTSSLVNKKLELFSLFHEKFLHRRDDYLFIVAAVDHFISY